MQIAQSFDQKQSQYLTEPIHLIESTLANSSSVIKQLINASQQIINQTVQQVYQESQIITQTQKNGDIRLSFEDQWNLLYFLRVFFYILVLLKLLELVCQKKRKMDIKERVYRKYVFSHSEMIRQFNEEDKKVMETTLNNTIKNATLDKSRPVLSKKISNKKVNFYESKNQYFEPIKSNDSQNKFLQFLNRTEEQIKDSGKLSNQTIVGNALKIYSQMSKQDPAQLQFEIIGTIEKQNDRSNIYNKNSKQMQSSLTENTEDTQNSSKLSNISSTSTPEQNREDEQRADRIKSQ